MKRTIIKKCIVFTLSMCIVLISLSAFSVSEQNTWDCPDCGRTGNTGNFCGRCAHPAPWMEEAEPDTEILSLPSVPILSELYPGSEARLQKSDDDAYRVYSYTGPGKSFVPSGGYKPNKQRKITVYFEENNWVLADVVYQTAEERTVYLPKYSLTSGENIPTVSDLDYYAGITTSDIVPSWGPDNRFYSVNSLLVPQGTEIKIYFQENGFVYAEYECTKGIVRMWLPADNIDIKNATISYSETPIIPAGQSSFR